MQTEFEAKFLNINKNELRQKLQQVGARLLRPEFMQKRVVFKLPSGHELAGAWVRVRDEGDKITLSLKIVDGDTIQDQKEVCLVVNSFVDAQTLLTNIGCEKKAYQESKREVWQLHNCEVCIDEWPYIEPYIEIEGPDEDSVKQTALSLGYEYSQAIFGSADKIIAAKYSISKDQINNHTPLITFDGPNPYILNK